MQAAPGYGNFQVPAFIYVVVVVNSTLYLNSSLQTGHIKIGKGPAYTAWMRTLPEAGAAAVKISSKRIGLRLVHIKLRNIKAAALFIGVLPDKEYFVYGVCGIYFQLIITIAAINKNLQVVFQKNNAVPCG